MTGLGVLVVGGIVGGVLGAAIGYGIGRLPLSPVVASAAAALLAWLAASLIGAVVWLARAAGESGIVAVSGGLRESAIMVAAVGVGAVCLHAVLGWACRTSVPWVMHHRPVVLGLLGGLIGAAMLRAIER